MCLGQLLAEKIRDFGIVLESIELALDEDS